MNNDYSLDVVGNSSSCCFKSGLVHKEQLDYPTKIMMLCHLSSIFSFKLELTEQLR